MQRLCEVTNPSASGKDVATTTNCVVVFSIFSTLTGGDSISTTKNDMSNRVMATSYPKSGEDRTLSPAFRKLCHHIAFRRQAVYPMDLRSITPNHE